MASVLSGQEPSVENVAIAMSCPFRDIFVLGEESRLFFFNRISSGEKKSLKKLLYRDFNITNEDSLRFALENISGNNNIFIAMTSLYIITSSIELGIISFSDYEELCKIYIRQVTCRNDLRTWHDISVAFKDGDCINNAIGKKVLEKSVDKLLTHKNSPWTVYSWDQIVTLDI